MFAMLTLERFAASRRNKSGLLLLASTSFIAIAISLVGGYFATFLQRPLNDFNIIKPTRRLDGPR